MKQLSLYPTTTTRIKRFLRRAWEQEWIAMLLALAAVLVAVMLL